MGGQIVWTSFVFLNVAGKPAGGGGGGQGGCRLQALTQTTNNNREAQSGAVSALQMGPGPPKGPAGNRLLRERQTKTEG